MDRQDELAVVKRRLVALHARAEGCARFEKRYALQEEHMVVTWRGGKGVWGMWEKKSCVLSYTLFLPDRTPRSTL